MAECKIRPETILTFTYIVLVLHDGQSNKPKHVVYQLCFFKQKTVSTQRYDDGEA
jgi:hypothetical protein